jgi:hypothetical protein
MLSVRYGLNFYIAFRRNFVFKESIRERQLISSLFHSYNCGMQFIPTIRLYSVTSEAFGTQK